MSFPSSRVVLPHLLVRQHLRLVLFAFELLRLLPPCWVDGELARLCSLALIVIR